MTPAQRRRVERIARYCTEAYPRRFIRIVILPDTPSHGPCTLFVAFEADDRFVSAPFTLYLSASEHVPDFPSKIEKARYKAQKRLDSTAR